MQTKDILKELRKSKGYSTMQDFCSAANISFSTYQNYETGKRIPTAEILIKLADFYGVTTDYLLGREQTDKKPNPITQLTNEEMEQRLLKAYFSLPEKLRNDFLKSMAEQLEKQSGTNTQSDDIQQSESRMVTVYRAARPAPGGEHELIHKEQMTEEEAAKLLAELESLPDADDDL